MARKKRAPPAKDVPRRKAPKAAQKKARKENQFEKGIEDFSEEIERMGEKFGRRMESRGKRMECCMRDTFGVAGPLLSSVAGLVLLAVMVWILGIISLPLGAGLLYNIHYFLLANMGWFFLIFLSFSYASYLSRKAGQPYMLVSPIVTAAGITVALWIVGNAVRIANISIGAETLAAFSSFINGGLWMFFYLFALLGYLIMIASTALGRVKGTQAPREKREDGHVRRHPVPGRLYRSGRERILGGVCGGIAEHLGIDPVIVRLLWIVGCLAWGFGVILYIICWIIIPRNPRDKWS